MCAFSKSVEHAIGCEVLDFASLHCERNFSLLSVVYINEHLAFSVRDTYVLDLKVNIAVVWSANIVVRLADFACHKVYGIARCLVELHVVDGEPVLILVAIAVEAEVDGLRLVERNNLERLLICALGSLLVLDAVCHVVGRVAVTPVHAKLLSVAI